jgi:hypothetical protein
MKKIEQIRFEVEITGNSILNGGHVESFKRLVAAGQGLTDAFSFIDEKGNKKEYSGITVPKIEKNLLDGTFRIFISRDCFLNAAVKNSNTLGADEPRTIAAKLQPAVLLGGWTLTEFGGSPLAKKGCIYLDHLKSQPMTALDLANMQPRSQANVPKLREGDKGSTSYTQKIHVGNLLYTAEGVLDLAEMKFLSLDTHANRLAMSPGTEKHPLVRQTFKHFYGSEMPELAAYKKPTDEGLCRVEEGLLLPDSVPLRILSTTLSRMLSAEIKKADGGGCVSRLSVLVGKERFDIRDEKDVARVVELVAKTGIADPMVKASQEDIEFSDATKVEKTPKPKKAPTPKKSQDAE